MEKIGLPRFVPSQMEVRYDVELPAAKVGGHGPGVTGPQGATGPQGPEGKHGHLGPQGHTGAQGEPGQNAAGWKMKGYKNYISELPAEGENGDCWYIGDDMFIYIGLGQGRTDTPGDAYISTPAAQRGSTGPQGAPSDIPGPEGPRGYQGLQGFQGEQGEIGYTGPQGEAGPQGPQGYRGYPGFTGAQGDQGLRGFQGEVGPIGPTGVQGPEGFRGFQGEQGLRGYQGYQGFQGDNGTSINIVGHVDTVDELPYPAKLGDAYEVDSSLYYFVGENKGWPSTPHDSYRGFRIDVYGVTGPQGAKGPQGEPGIQGQALDSDIQISETIVVNLGPDMRYVGGYRNGDVILAGTTLKSVLKKLFTRVDTPEYIQPDIVIDPSMVFTFRTGQPRNLKVDFAQNDAGPLERWYITKDGVVLATGTSDHIEFSDTTKLTEDVTYRVRCEYSEGQIKYDSLGYEVPGHILAGSIEIELIFTYEMTHNFFCRISDNNIVESELTSIDQFTDYGIEVIAGQLISVSIPEGTKSIAIVVPSNLPIQKIIDSNWNANVISSFEVTEKQYIYDGTQNRYKLYLYNALTGLDSVTYRVIM